jgi:hypothetical protein
MHRRGRTLLLLWTCAASACGGAAARDSGRATTAQGVPAASATSVGGIAPALRGGAMSMAAPPAAAAPPLAASATFGDLVRAAAARASSGALDARSDCLLRVGSEGYALDAELMPALSELAEPIADVDAALAGAGGPVRVLTAWGQVGALEPDLGFAAFTALSPQSLRAPVVALLLGDAGAYLRYGDGPASEADGPLAIDAVVPRLLAQPRAQDAVLYVAAEEGTPLARLAELLRALPHDRRIALAQLLPTGTRLPPLVAQTPPAQQLCPDGLPEPEAASREGELDPAAAMQALAPLRDGARACLQDATGAARAGGRVVLALRVGETGAVQHACLLQDGIGDAALAACVLQSARSARLPAPTPAGFVDLHVPLSLTPEPLPALRALCE